MIESSADNIHILYPDGSSAVFDSSELRLRLARALAEANLEDLSITEEIALAVEFTLRNALRESGINTIPAAELDRAVAKSLEDAGFALVSEKFLALSPASTAAGKLSEEDLPHFLIRSLGIGESEAEVLGEKVRVSLLKLGLEKCSPRLALELAREFRDIAAAELLKKRQMKILRTKKILLPQAADILPHLEESYRELVETGIVKPGNCTALFPSVRVEIFLEKLLERVPEEQKKELPLTELFLAPFLGLCAGCIDRIYEEMVKSTPAGKLPLVITFSDMGSFAEKYLLSGNMEGSPEKCGKNLGSYFKGMLKNPPFRIRYGK